MKTGKKRATCHISGIPEELILGRVTIFLFRQLGTTNDANNPLLSVSGSPLATS
jgi:hypothetical protein